MGAHTLALQEGAQGAPRVVQPGPVLGPLDALGGVHHLLLLRPPHLPHLPLWVFRLLSLGLLIFPLEGHWGYGNWKSELASALDALDGSVNHYLHHAKFNWNYGSSPMWDHLMGTNYTGSDSGSARADNAIKQAALVGCSLAEGGEQPEKKKK